MGRQVGSYRLGRTLGEGSFATVKYAEDVTTNVPYAIKVIDKRRIVQGQLEEQLKREIAVMKHLNHENITQLKEVLQTERRIYLVLDLATGGDLHSRIVAAKRFDERTARNYFQQLISAVQYCHRRGVAHRDLKPENLLLDGKGQLKVTDFGISNLQKSSCKLQTVCGSPYYVAPEVLKEEGYDGFTADLWSCGAILFVMLAGQLPIPNQHGQIELPSYFSPEAKDLLSKMLVEEPKERCTLDDVVVHPWVLAGRVSGGKSQQAIPCTDPPKHIARATPQEPIRLVLRVTV